jgi:beta-barrel assembly-enhancing protease
MSKQKGLLWVGAACGVAAAVAFGLPLMARHVPWAVERWIARVVSPPIPANACRGVDAQADQALERLVRRIYPLDDEDRELPITVEVLPGSAINAFATLGGRIYVFDGLIRQAQSPDELAGVLAHEIEHVRRRHVLQGVITSVLTWGALASGGASGVSAGPEAAYVLLTLKFSRDQEAEADELGLQRLRRARVDPTALARFFTRLGRLPSPPPLLSNHPASGTRAELAARYAGYPTEVILDEADWARLAHLCR